MSTTDPTRARPNVRQYNPYGLVVHGSRSSRA